MCESHFGAIAMFLSIGSPSGRPPHPTTLVARCASQQGWLPMSESGPGCVKTSVSRGCRELFSHFRLLAEVASAIEFPHLRNLERCSTRKLNDGVFTQPGSKADFGARNHHVRFTPTKRTSGSRPGMSAK